MKKIVVLLLAASALLSFSCNKYCNCRHYIDGERDKPFNNNFVKESNLNCEDYSTLPVKQEDGKTYETRCK